MWPESPNLLVQSGQPNGVEPHRLDVDVDRLASMVWDAARALDLDLSIDKSSQGHSAR